MWRERGLDRLDNIVSGHDIRGKLCRVLEGLSDLLYWHMEEVMSILVIVDGFLLDFTRGSRWCCRHVRSICIVGFGLMPARMLHGS